MSILDCAIFAHRPDIPLERHGPIFQDACAYQSLAAAEESCLWWQARLGALALPGELLASSGIIATFHTGSYRLLPRWLRLHGLPFSLVVSNAVHATQGRRFRALAGNPGPDRFDIIDAEQPHALLGMRKALRAGKYLLIYIDGNAGALPIVANQGAVIPFFEGRIRVRTGLAHLAYLADVPIYPVMQQRTPDGQSPFSFRETIRADHALKRATAALDVTKQLYRLLEHEIHDNPEQWENWFHLRPILPPDSQAGTAGSRADAPAWITAWSGKKAYRIDRKTGACFHVTGAPLR